MSKQELEAVRAEVTAKGTALLRSHFKTTGVPVSAKEFQHLVRVAVFEATRDAAQPSECVQRALHHLRKMVLGQESDFRDAVLRNRYRRGCQDVVAVEWTAWQQHEPDDRLPLDVLPTLLAKCLQDRELKWLLGRYLHSETSQQQAEEYAKTHPQYQTARGLKRAEVMINVAVYRARLKARKYLGALWHEEARSVACGSY